MTQRRTKIYNTVHKLMAYLYHVNKKNQRPLISLNEKYTLQTDLTSTGCFQRFQTH